MRPTPLALPAAWLLALGCVEPGDPLPLPPPPDAGLPNTRPTPRPDGGQTPPADAGQCTPQSCLRQSIRCGMADDGCGNPLDCGVCGRWSRTSDEGAPELRRLGAAAWDGEGLFLWGGTNGVGPPDPVGARYLPAQARWVRVSEQDAPPATLNPCVVPIDGGVFVFGGTDIAMAGARATNEGGLYDAATDRWTPLPREDAPAPRSSPACVRVGQTVLVVGGARAPQGSAALFDLEARRWQPLDPAPGRLEFPEATASGNAAYIGHDAWLRYEPGRGFTPLATEGQPPARTRMGLTYARGGLWVFGGSSFGSERYDTMHRYDSVIERWQPVEAEDRPSPRRPLVFEWTGEEILTWGCLSGCSDGFHFDPETQAWRRMAFNPEMGAPESVYGAWTGEALIIVYGGPGREQITRGWLYRPAD